MTEGFQRARRPEHKQLRREHLMATARQLLDDGITLPELGLNELARSAQISKANVYRYFESREAVMLALLAEEVTRFWERLSPKLRPGRRAPTTIDKIVRVLARSLADEPLLCALTAAVPSVLEANLSAEAIGSFKRDLLAFFREAADTLEACCPELSHDEYVTLLYDTINLIVGLYPMTHPSPQAAKALEAIDLEFFRRDFAKELERFIGALADDAVSRLSP